MKRQKLLWGLLLPVLFFSCTDATVSGDYPNNNPYVRSDDDAETMDDDTDLVDTADVDPAESDFIADADPDVTEEENADSFENFDNEPEATEMDQEPDAMEDDILEQESEHEEESDTPPTCLESGGYCMTGDWERSLAYPCNPGFFPDESPRGCEQSWLWCCTPMESGCIAEGRIGVEAQGDSCCEGSVRIENRYPGNAGGCESGTDGTFLCTNCGNGVCELYENRCNCTSDCAGAGTCTPSTTIDCPATTCRNRDNIWPTIESDCVTYEYTCDEDSQYCLKNENSLSNYICNMHTGQCELP